MESPSSYFTSDGARLSLRGHDSSEVERLREHMKMIDKFNDQNVHLVISAWPEKTNHGEINHGIAWYTKLVLTYLAKHTNSRFVVLAEKGSHNKRQFYQRGRILVLRVFDNTHPSLYPTILTWLKRFPLVTKVTVHSEFGVNAGFLHYLLLLPFLALIRLTGKDIIYFAHNVVTDVSFLQKHLNLPPLPLVTFMCNLFIRLHARLLVLLSTKIVVLDETLLKRLAHLVPKNKLYLSPIPVEAKSLHLSNTRAKKRLGIAPHTKVLLAFGFVSAYKGTDWLMETFVKYYPGKNYHLIIAGGPAHSLKDKPYYQAYYQRLTKIAENHSRVTLTEFVPERDIPLYFAAADLVVLPYRGLMGASGALTHALSFGKPFVLSQAMAGLWQTKHFQAARRDGSLSRSTAFFSLTPGGMDKIITTLADPAKIAQLRRLSLLLRRQRSIVSLISDQYGMLYQTQTAYVTNKHRYALQETLAG